VDIAVKDGASDPIRGILDSVFCWDQRAVVIKAKIANREILFFMLIDFKINNIRIHLYYLLIFHTIGKLYD
jgi:hypothetical protein